MIDRLRVALARLLPPAPEPADRIERLFLPASRPIQTTAFQIEPCDCTCHNRKCLACGQTS